MRQVKIQLLPGGMMPGRQTEGAIGFDVHLRALVCPHTLDPTDPTLRKTLFDFKARPEGEMGEHVFEKDGRLVYRLRSHETVLGGIGFRTEMPYPMFYWVAPRSGLASKHGITVANAPGTVDPDYRGEAGVILYNQRDTDFDLYQNMRIAQVIFQEALIPTFIEVGHRTELVPSERNAGGFGSTGLG